MRPSWFSWARAVCREIAKHFALAGSKLTTIAKAATAAAVERYAQSDQAMAVTQAIWDCDLYLLGTPGGTVDLRTGELNRADYRRLHQQADISNSSRYGGLPTVVEIPQSR